MVIPHIKFNKKSLISLEALIILIAIIVIAAIAAGVILRQSGVLSQRAITVGDQSRERLVSGLEIITFTGTANISDESLNDFELLLRLKPGSLPIQLKNLKILFTTQNVAISSSLAHTTATDLFTDIDISGASSNWINITDIEDNILESSFPNTKEQVRYNSATNNLEVNFSYASNYVDEDDEGNLPGALATVSIGDLSSAGTTPVAISVIDQPLEVNGVTIAFVTISGTATVDNSLTGTTATIFNTPSNNVCRFDKLISEKRFCFVNKIGNGDTTVDSGELVGLRFKMKPFNLVPIETIYEIQLLPKEGAIESIHAVTPSTLVVENTKLWG